MALRYFGIDKPILPYRTYTSPVDEAPHWITGSVNVLGSQMGFLQKRFGFADALEAALSTLPGTVKRLYGWRRWVGSKTNSGVFFIMASIVTPAKVAQVWKLNLSTDQSFSLLWDETTAPLGSTVSQAATGVPFDFVATNNFVAFGNASSRTNMRKYDGVYCSLWGLDAPPAAPTFSLVNGDLPAGFTFDAVNGVLSGTPTAAAVNTLTVTVTDATGATFAQSLNLTVDRAGLQWTTKAGALPVGVSGQAYSQQLAAQSGKTPYTFALYSGKLPAGVTLSASGLLSGTPSAPGLASFSVKVTDSTTPVAAVAIRSFSLFIGAAGLTFAGNGSADGTVGNPYSWQVTPSGGTAPYTFSFASGGVPGMAWVNSNGASPSFSLTGNPTTAGIYPVVIKLTDANNNVFEFNGTIRISAVSLTALTTSIPDAQVGVPYSQPIVVSGGSTPYTFSVTAGALSAQTGYVWGYTYTSYSGHESAMSPLSDNSGLFTDLDGSVDLTASIDPQVNGINVYRTSDGGVQTPSEMRLVASLTNTSTSYLDATQDIYLGEQTGPALYLNDPPQPLRGFVWSNGRIWGFNKQATWFTGNEEIINGTPFECMSDAKNGNVYPWPSEVFGLAVTSNGVDIALSEEFWQVSGDTLDTFRKSPLLTGGGVLSPTCITSVGDTVFWVDTGRQVWSSDKGEIGASIRPDLANIDPLQTFITYHKFGMRNWLLILDGANARLLIYDMDLEQWQVPWTVSATALASAQTAPAAIDLLAAFTSNRVRKLSLTAHNDDGATYADQLRLSLLPTVPGARTTSRNTELVQQAEQWEMETDSDATGQPNYPDHFYMLSDANPTTIPLSKWVPLTEPQPLQFGANWLLDGATSIAGTRWTVDSGLALAARRMAFCAVWDADDSPWSVYTFDLALKPSLVK